MDEPAKPFGWLWSTLQYLQLQRRWYHRTPIQSCDPTTMVLQIITLAVFFGLLTIAVLAFIEPGPLDRRSRDRKGRKPPLPGSEDDPTERPR